MYVVTELLSHTDWTLQYLLSNLLTGYFLISNKPQANDKADTSEDFYSVSKSVYMTQTMTQTLEARLKLSSLWMTHHMKWSSWESIQQLRKYLLSTTPASYRLLLLRNYSAKLDLLWHLVKTDFLMKHLKHYCFKKTNNLLSENTCDE